MLVRKYHWHLISRHQRTQNLPQMMEYCTWVYRYYLWLRTPSEYPPHTFDSRLCTKIIRQWIRFSRIKITTSFHEYYRFLCVSVFMSFILFSLKYLRKYTHTKCKGMGINIVTWEDGVVLRTKTFNNKKGMGFMIK